MKFEVDFSKYKFALTFSSALRYSCLYLFSPYPPFGNEKTTLTIEIHNKHLVVWKSRINLKTYLTRINSKANCKEIPWFPFQPQPLWSCNGSCMQFRVFDLLHSELAKATERLMLEL